MNKSWTKEQDYAIRVNYQTLTSREIAALVDHGDNSVRSRARRMGISKCKHLRRYWTTKEITWLSEVYSVVGLNARHHLNRSKNSVKAQAQKLGLRRLSKSKGPQWRDITGLKYPLGVKVIRMDERAKWLCSCHCGNTFTATSNKLNSGTKKSCGCLGFKREPGPFWNPAFAKWPFNVGKRSAKKEAIT